MMKKYIIQKFKNEFIYLFLKFILSMWKLTLGYTWYKQTKMCKTKLWEEEVVVLFRSAG
jgi:hypothetical protein